MPLEKVYLDHSATTPVDPEVVSEMSKYLTENFGNPSSMHSYGQESDKAVENARGIVASFLNCQTAEVFFTSGATESDNLAIIGVVKPKDHIITTTIEHPAVFEVCRELEKRGVSVSYVSVGKNGIVDPAKIIKEVKPNTVLISVMYVNNEIGTVQPIEIIGGLIDKVNTNRQQKILFHTDAVQAAGYFSLDTKKLKVDLLSISGHKIYGPKGIGALFVKKGVSIRPIQFGGHQESGLRPGTVNAPGVIGLGKAISLIMDQKRQKEIITKIKKIRDYILEEIPKKIPDTFISGDCDKRSPANAHFCFAKVEGESILLSLDFEGIAVSTGSACSSGSLEPSHVLLAIGIPIELSHGSLRVTFGKDNTITDAKRLITALPPIIKKLRKMSPLK